MQLQGWSPKDQMVDVDKNLLTLETLTSLTASLPTTHSEIREDYKTSNISAPGQLTDYLQVL